MATNMAHFSRSPLNMLSSYMGGSGGEDSKALKQAFYNTAATLFVLFAGLAAVSVYYILEAFIRPLLWAVLCGSFLHPFKSTLTSLLKGWLKNLRQSSTPLLLGTMLIPVRILDSTVENLSSFFIQHARLILIGTLSLLCLNMFYYFGPLQQIFTVLKAIFFFLYEALGYFSAFWVWSLVLAYALVVVFFWSPQSSAVLRHLSIPVWLALVFHIANIAGIFRVPLLILVLVTISVGFMSEVKEARKRHLETHTSGEGQTSPSAIAIWNIWSNSNRYKSDRSERSENKDVDASLSSSSDFEKSTSSESSSEVKVKETRETKSQADQPVTTATSEDVTDRPSPRETRPAALRLEEGAKTDSEPVGKESRSLVDRCFIALIWALVLVRLWMNIWIINLLPVLFVCLILKKFGTSLGSWVWLQEKCSSFMKTAKEKVTNDERFEILTPKPIRGVGKLILRGDRKIIRTLEGSLDHAVTILMVFLLFVGAVLGSFFIAVQVQRESMHLVSVTSNVLNQSLHPELTQWLPNNDEMQKHMDSMVGNAYLYGREWLAQKLQGVVNGDDAKKSNVENQVLEVWDRLYEKWFVRANSSSIKQVRPLVNRQMSFDLTNISNVWDLASFSTNFNLDFMEIATENYGTFMQVVDSIWGVLKGNLNLVMSILSATVSLLLGGGTAILNFVLSLMVFITTLFYLLASSGDLYKPMEWISGLNPTGGASSKFGATVEQAIGSVFLASLKMALFYGLYTWLTHTMFGIQIVFIPSALAAVFAAIPFVGTYVAALPAVIELWLVNGQRLQALLLIGCHLLPMFFVDTAIYSEVKGGHPYLTGLAIAGGIYWMGLEGAIIGPILLCCLIVAMNVYRTMLQPNGVTSEPMSGGRKPEEDSATSTDT